MMTTFSAKPKEVDRDWYVIDAAGKPLGRVASRAAQVLRGKYKPTFTYNQDVGDHVIVVNAEKVVLTGNKREELIYWHTTWPGGLRSISRGKVLDTRPERLLQRAIWGMTPKTRLGRRIIRKLRIYRGMEHPHAAQNPKTLEV
ncbi:MAG: 50S ribosomal protein L13 [Fimbriimonadia bacterium]|jgi:large subunit ribosomal protein L13